MDARLQVKFEERAKDGFLRKRDRIAATSKRFEEVIEELVDAAGMRFEPEPMVNGKRPDGVIHHDRGRVYIEAVCAQGPDAFNDERGEVDLCAMLSPKLIEQNLHMYLSYETLTEGELGASHVLHAKPLKESVSSDDAASVFKEVQVITQEAPSLSGSWQGEIEIRGSKLTAYIHQQEQEITNVHIGHSACAVAFIKNGSRSGLVSNRYEDDRNRVRRKIKKYCLEGLEGYRLIVALFSQDAWTHESAAAVAFGTIYPKLSLTEDPNSGELVPIGTSNVLLPDGIWYDAFGRHQTHLAAIWIFNSFDTANNLPLLAINPFLDDQEVQRAIPKRLMDVSVVCRPRLVGGVYT